MTPEDRVARALKAATGRWSKKHKAEAEESKPEPICAPDAPKIYCSKCNCECDAPLYKRPIAGANGHTAIFAL